MFGDVRWNLDFWLSQLSFWCATVKSFTNVWVSVVLDGENIGKEVDWDEAITLYVIADFKYVAKNSDYSVVKKQWIEKYKYYTELERKNLIDQNRPDDTET